MPPKLYLLQLYYYSSSIYCLRIHHSKHLLSLLYILPFLFFHPPIPTNQASARNGGNSHFWFLRKLFFSSASIAVVKFSIFVLNLTHSDVKHSLYLIMFCFLFVHYLPPPINFNKLVCWSMKQSSDITTNHGLLSTRCWVILLDYCSVRI